MIGKRVALSGAIEGMSRADFRTRVEEAGGEYVAILDDAVDLLVIGDSPLQSKLARAESVGVVVQPWEQFKSGLEQAAASLDAPLINPEVQDAPQPAVVQLDGFLQVLDVVIPKSAHADEALVPSLSEFDHYTLDAPTLSLLRFLGRAVALGHPCLLEGETATSKTSAVRFLAAKLGQPVVRLNLNGQTDAAELVGRFVPDGAGWKFAEGLVPEAMRRGWWVVLDEVNLAEPAVLERLNPVLERHPSLVLTEGDGSRIGPGGAAVHPSFRIFATMNPADYQGRSVLSPAWRDRFLATWQATVPGELEFRQMLRRLVFGTQPTILWGGRRWVGEADEQAPYRALAAVEGVEGLLSRLASVHAAVITMANPADGQPASLGGRRRERYMFSRRGLLAVLTRWLDCASSTRCSAPLALQRRRRALYSTPSTPPTSTGCAARTTEAAFATYCGRWAWCGTGGSIRSCEICERCAASLGWLGATRPRRTPPCVS